MRPIPRVLAPVLLFLVLAASFVATDTDSPARAQAPTLVYTSSVTYDVATTDQPVRVRWDVSIVNNDPETVDDGSGFIQFYEALALPVIPGAGDLSATDADGATLDVTVSDEEQIVDLARVEFSRPLFFGDTYAFTLTYDVVSSQADGVLVTPNYIFVPAVAAGENASVTVNTPAGAPWEVSLDEQECAANGNTFVCSGKQAGYLAAIVEASQPGATASEAFDVPLPGGTLTVTLRYFAGQEAAAAHQRALITAALPVIEQVMGFDYAGPATLDISHGGRQAILGYEGVTSCGTDSCDVVVSPVADDYTVLHELSHLWSKIFRERWLSEGFAQLVPEEVAPQLPEGTVTGDPPTRTPSTYPLQLDDWGEELTPVIGADDAAVERIDAGYDYSLRFLQDLRGEFGMETLRAVNRNIAGSGEQADSRRFMDVLEDATGANLDTEFLTWVFPRSYEPTLSDRREARQRAADIRARLTDEQLPDDGLIAIDRAIKEWSFTAALASLDTLEANIDTYVDLSEQLRDLESDANGAGLTLAPNIEDALMGFDFEAARTLITSAETALTAYRGAQADVRADRSLWERFGLLGSDPDGELDEAKDAFEAGNFTQARGHSERASEMVDEASSVAVRRMLVVAGFLAVLALVIAVAIGVGQYRRRAALR
jgi:hypothetical protein